MIPVCKYHWNLVISRNWKLSDITINIIVFSLITLFPGKKDCLLDSVCTLVVFYNRCHGFMPVLCCGSAAHYLLFCSDDATKTSSDHTGNLRSQLFYSKEFCYKRMDKMQKTKMGRRRKERKNRPNGWASWDGVLRHSQENCEIIYLHCRDPDKSGRRIEERPRKSRPLQGKVQV